MKLAKQLSRVMLQTMLYDANAPSQQNLLDLHAVHCALGQHLFWRHGRLRFDLATAQPLEVLRQWLLHAEHAPAAGCPIQAMCMHALSRRGPKRCTKRAMLC